MTVESRDLRVVFRSVERIERQLRVMKVTGAVVLAVGAFVLLTAQANNESEIVEARGFLVKDSAGKDSALLIAGLLGPRLVFYDENEKIRVDLTASELALFDEGGNKSISLVHALNSSGLLLFDDKENARVRLVLLSERGLPGGMRIATGPGLALHDEKGNIRALFGNAFTQERLTGEITEQTTASVLLFDENETIVFEAP